MRFSLSTWNCFGMARSPLDAITGRRAPEPDRLRHQRVVAECAASGVLCVQELFSRDAEDFFDGLSSPRARTSIRDHNRLHLRSATVRGMGLGIRSHGELLESGRRQFREGTGWDRLARKGVLHARIALDDAFELDVFTVHLQAGYDRAAEQVRKTQLSELGEFLAGTMSPKRATIVCGDFNIDGLEPARDRPEYRCLLSTLEGFSDLGATDDHATFDPTPHVNSLAFRSEPDGLRQRLDYVFLKPAASGTHAIECQSLSLFLAEPLGSSQDGRHDFASDHFGLVASFECSKD
jgi:endonuclease/exonuclease/phosphatase family metal-dependent hydrolase